MQRAGNGTKRKRILGMSVDLMVSLTNHQWLMLKVGHALSERDLEQVAIDIECDKFEGEPWTEDETKLNQLRSRWEIQSMKLKERL